jgi:hypothetical protein
MGLYVNANYDLALSLVKYLSGNGLKYRRRCLMFPVNFKGITRGNAEEAKVHR